MRWRLAFIGALSALAATSAAAQTNARPNFVRVEADVIAIAHVTLIDGTGAAPKTDQTVIIDHGRITAVGHPRVPAGATTIDGHGKTLIPGMVGMHEHMFAPAPVQG